MKDDVGAPDGVDLDANLHMKTDCEDEEDEQEDHEKEEKEVDEDEEEDEEEDNCKQPQKIGLEEMVNRLEGNAVTTVDDQPTVLP